MNEDKTENIGHASRFGSDLTLPRRSGKATPAWSGQIMTAVTPPAPLSPPPAHLSMTTASLRLDDGPALPPRDWSKQSSSTLTISGTSNCPYDKVTITPDSNANDEEKHVYLDILGQRHEASNINDRIQKIELMQISLTKQFVDFKKDLITEILSLKEVSANLAKFVEESSSKHQTSIEKTHFQMLENSDHLGKQIMDVRRDIAVSNKKRLYVHSFEWEVQNFESFVKNQKDCTSSFNHIAQIDCKVYGEAVCTKDMRLRLKLLGVLAHSPSSPLKKSTKFECNAFILDKSGRQPDWRTGKVFGDFNTEKEWIIGDVACNEVKKKGFVHRSGDLYLKCVIELSF